MNIHARAAPASLAAPVPSYATLPSGMLLPYAASGAGEPLLFVHGSLCDYRYWNGQAAALSSGFLCLSVSLGHYWPAADAAPAGTFGWRAHVDELAGFIAALGVGPVHLVGHSRGACVAFQLARARPRLVASLVLADPAGPLQDQGAPPPAPVTDGVRAEVAALIEAGAVEAGLEMFVDAVSLPGTWRRSSPAFRRMAADNAATLPKQFRDPLPPYTRDGAGALRCRTLLIAGERSPIVYRANAARLAEWIPGAGQRIIAGASHGMNVTHAASFNRLLREFAGAPLSA